LVEQVKHGFENRKRIVRDYTIHISATPDRIFPLLCPVREYEWIETWKCEMIYSKSGFAELGCIFKTRHAGDDADDYWTVVKYEPGREIEFVVTSNLRIMLYRFVLIPEGNDRTKIFVEQVATALDEKSESRIEDTGFTLHMKILEIMLEHFAVTGKMIPNEEAIRIASGH